MHASASRDPGSARAGVDHWLLQRLTAVALVPLGLWFVASMVALSGEPYEVVRGWLSGLFNATMMVLLVIAAFWHARLGLRVIIEDYVHTPGLKVAALMLTDLLSFAFATSCIVAVIVIAAGG